MRYKQVRFAEPGYVPKIRGYARVSHKSQHDKGNSIADQEARIQAYIKMRQIDGVFAGAEWHGMYIEPKAQSAYSRPFMSRIAGKRLWEDLNPGDHVVVDKLDRMFRSVHDFCSCDKFFGERGIRVHFVNYKGMSLDTGTWMGDFMIKLFALMAEGESDRIGERTATARQMLRVNGRHQGVKLPVFCELRGARPGAKCGGGGVMIFREWALPLMKEIKERKDSGEGFHAMGVKGIYQRLQALGVNIGTTPPEHLRVMRNMYWFYSAWMDCGQPNINTIKIRDMIYEYKRKLETNGTPNV